MSDEQKVELETAILEAAHALNECVVVFVGLARKGRYPHALDGIGWEFATSARDRLMGEAKRSGLLREEDADIDLTI